MKVVQINSACTYGSTGKIVVGISSLMNEYEIDNLVFYSGNHKCSYPNSKLINSKLNIRVHQIMSRVFGNQGWYSYLSTKKLIRELKKFKPDIIHIHNIHGYYLNMPIFFKYLSRFGGSVIWTLHDCWAFTGHCTHYSSKKCYKWTHRCMKCPQMRSYPYSWFFDRSKELFIKKGNLYRNITKLKIITVSHWLREQVQMSPLLGNREIDVIPNGIDLAIYRPGKILKTVNGVDISNKKIVLGVANNWGKTKGYEDFLELSKHLPLGWYAIMVGLSNKQISNLPNNIIGVRHTNCVADLVDLYTTATVHFCSSTEETFGLTIVESMACGTPVIVYNATACPELINGKNGYVVEPHAIHDVIERLSDIESKGKEWFKQECINFAKRYENKKIYKRYIDLYCQEVTDGDKDS